MEIEFSAHEFRDDEKFHLARYKYQGDESSGWKIYRKGELFETLGKGYVLLKTCYCGICSTDIARANLPFKLPQITGHELVASLDERFYVVEINASHKARGVKDATCFYCNNDMDIHCQERLTLGIDRLPGGFSPYVLAPRNSLIPIPSNISTVNASITEPFAAAYHAVTTSVRKEHRSVAVVGPRRLGSLLLLALKLYREKWKINFTITAVIRNEAMKDFCIKVGADNVVGVSEIIDQKYDVVFDTTGSESGFLQSLRIAGNILHIKSTSGKPVEGLTRLTEMVIDELSLASVTGSKRNILYKSIEDDSVSEVAVDESIPQVLLEDLTKCFPEKIFSRLNFLGDFGESRGYNKQYDLAIASNLHKLNHVVRNCDGKTLMRAKSKLFLYKEGVDGGVSVSGELEEALFTRDVQLHTSRCGSFKHALKIMSENDLYFEEFSRTFISEIRDIEELDEAFEEAKSDRKKIKIVMRH